MALQQPLAIGGFQVGARHGAVEPGFMRCRRVAAGGSLVQELCSIPSRTREVQKAKATRQRAFKFYFGEPPPPPWWQRPKTWLVGAAIVCVAAMFLAIREQRRNARMKKRAGMRQNLEALMTQASPRTTPKFQAEKPAPAAEPVPPPAPEPEVEAKPTPAAAPAEPEVAPAPAATPEDAATPAETAPAEEPAVEEAAAEAASGEEVLGDGRRVLVCADEAEARSALLSETVAAATAALAKKGAFSIAVCGDDTAEALAGLSGESSLDFSKFHVFFCYDKLGSRPCYTKAQEMWISKCKVPEQQVHAVSSDANIDGSGAAAMYTANMCMQEENVILEGDGGLPAFDLVLLSTRDDGTCGGLSPGAAPPEAEGQVIMPVKLDGESALTMTVEGINSSQKAIVLAAAPSRKEMVEQALSSSADASLCPASQVRAQSTLWIVSKGSR